jgi:integrase
LADLRPRHVERLKEALLASGLAPQTVGDILRVLSQALRKAVARELMARNPADSAAVDRPRGVTAEVHIVTEDVARGILSTVRGTDPWDPAVHLALGASMRREEVLGLRWSDVSFDAGRAMVGQTVTWAGGVLNIEEATKTRKSRRSVPLPAFVVEALRRHRAAQAERRLRLGAAWQESGLVVDRGDGRPWSPPSFSKGWGRFATRTALPPITFHGLRHGYATLMLAAGEDIKVVSEIMGHANPAITHAIYQHVIPRLKTEAAGRLDRLIGS